MRQPWFSACLSASSMWASGCRLLGMWLLWFEYRTPLCGCQMTTITWPEESAGPSSISRRKGWSRGRPHREPARPAEALDLGRERTGQPSDDRYADAPDARFGLLAWSRDKLLERDAAVVFVPPDPHLDLTAAWLQGHGVKVLG